MVKGVELTVAGFKAYSKEIQEAVKDIIEDVTLNIERQAIANAPGPGDQLETTGGMQENTTGINQFIHSEFTNDGFTGTVFISQQASVMAIYVEFGTGIWARNYVPTLPMEIQKVARKYFINGNGTLVNQPFLLPAYFQHSPDVIKRIKKALENAKRI